MPVYEDKNKKKYFYKVNYTDNQGNYKQYHSKYFDTKKSAKLAEAEFLANIGEAKGVSKTFDEIAAEFLSVKKKRLKPNGYLNLQYKVNHVLEHLSSVRIDKMTVSQYKKFYYAIENENYSVAYKNMFLSTCKRLIDYANKMYGISSTVPDQFDNFRDANKKAKTFNIYTKEEFEQYISVVYDIQYKTFFTCLFTTGMRKGEACALTWNDILFDEKKIVINKTFDVSSRKLGSPKTISSNRVIPITERLITLLRSLHKAWSRSDNFSEDWYVFGGYKPFGSSIDDKNAQYSAEAHLKKIRIHDFRHSFASYVINDVKTIPITSLSKYLGHANPQVTLSTYSHYYEKDLSDIPNSFE